MKLVASFSASVSALGLALVFLFSFPFAGSRVGAQEPVSLTLAEAVEIALEKNPMIFAGDYLLEGSRHKIVQARSGLFPQLKVSERFTRTTNPMWSFGAKLNQEKITRADFDPRLLNHPDPIENFQTVLTITYPLYDRGKIRKGIEQARLYREAASLDHEAIGQEVAINAVTAYLNVLLAQEEVQVVQKSLDTARAHHRMIEARHKSGLVVKSDLLRSQVHVAQLEQELQSALASLEVAFGTLWSALGEKAPGKVSLTTRLEDITGTLSPLEEWLKKAFIMRPDLRKAQIELEIAKKELEKARAEYWPAIYLSGAYEINTEDFDETANSYSIGAVLELDLFSGFRTRAKVREAMAQVKRAEAMIQALKLRIQVEVKQAYYQARSAWNRISVARGAVQQAREALRIVRNRYETGLFHLVQLLDAETALQQARLNHIRALHGFHVAFARLSQASGTVFEYTSKIGGS